MKKLLLLLPLLLPPAFSGCDDSEDGDFDHKPPPGKGALVVDNQTNSKFEVYVDGEQLGRVSTFDDKTFNLEPGLRRVIVDEDDGRRSEALDVDILENRLTVLRIQSDFAVPSSISVDVYLD